MKKSLSKLLTLALALTMALSLTACGGGDKPAETPNTDKETTQENAANDISTDEAEELPGKIDVELHTTYSIKDYCDITFSDPYVSDENATEHGASGVTITVPATVTITSSGKTLRGLIMRAQLLDERGHSVQQTFTEKYDADELEPGKTYQASYSLFLSDKTEPEALYASIIMNMHEFSVPVDLTKIRPTADAPEVPSEIEIVTGETYSLEGGLDITFGEITYGDIYMMDGIATQSTFGFELPVTIHNVSNDVITYANIRDLYNDKWGTYVFDEKENENDYVCQIDLLYTDRVSYPKQDDIIDVDAKWDTVLKTGRINRFDNIGFAEIKLMGTTFIIHYDATEFLTSNNIPID